MLWKMRIGLAPRRPKKISASAAIQDADRQRAEQDRAAHAPPTICRNRPPFSITSHPTLPIRAMQQDAAARQNRRMYEYNTVGTFE